MVWLFKYGTFFFFNLLKGLGSMGVDWDPCWISWFLFYC